MTVSSFLKALWGYRTSLTIFLVPVLLLPLPLVISTSEAKCAYVVLIMAVFWTTEVLPLAVTGLLPMLLFPLLQVAKPADLSAMYFKDIIVMFIGGLILALAIEKWNLHKRIALRIILWVGTGERWLLAGFMLTTAFLSMWVSNAAVTAMMMPIVQAVADGIVPPSEDEKRKPERNNSNIAETANETLSEISSGETRDVDPAQQKENGETIQNVTINKEPKIFDYESRDDRDRNIRKMLFICIAYSASIGGAAVITGSGPSLVFKGFIDQLSGGKSVVTFGTWLLFSLPSAVICLFFAWVWLQMHFLGWRSIFCCRKSKTDDEQVNSTKSAIQTEYDNLGRITFPEKAVLVHFIVQVLLWFLLDPGIFPGYKELFENGYVTISTSSVLILVSLFICPSKFPHVLRFKWCRKGKPDSEEKNNSENLYVAAPPLLEWPMVVKALPWGLFLLIGGAFALAHASQVSGLSIWMANEMSGLQGLPGWALVLVLSIIIATATELTSNVAITSIFLPIAGSMARTMNLNPLYLMMPVTIASTFAFMLPVATPPNAIVYSYGEFTVIDMAKAGVVLNIVCILVLTLAIHTWGVPILQLNTIPDWFASVNSTMS